MWENFETSQRVETLEPNFTCGLLETSSGVRSSEFEELKRKLVEIFNAHNKPAEVLEGTCQALVKAISTTEDRRRMNVLFSFLLAAVRCNAAPAR